MTYVHGNNSLYSFIIANNHDKNKVRTIRYPFSDQIVTEILILPTNNSHFLIKIIEYFIQNIYKKTKMLLPVCEFGHY